MTYRSRYRPQQPSNAPLWIIAGALCVLALVGLGWAAKESGVGKPANPPQPKPRHIITGEEVEGYGEPQMRGVPSAKEAEEHAKKVLKDQKINVGMPGEPPRKN